MYFYVAAQRLATQVLTVKETLETTWYVELYNEYIK